VKKNFTEQLQSLFHAKHIKKELFLWLRNLVKETWLSVLVLTYNKLPPKAPALPLKF